MFEGALTALVKQANENELHAMIMAAQLELADRQQEDARYAAQVPIIGVPFAGAHTFTSGAKSSGHKPRYVQSMSQFCWERFANHRATGDQKYGEDNYLLGVRDRDFILDRINHGIEHLLHLAAEVKAQDPGNWVAGNDDAAAVMCAGMFVMCWQEATLNSQARHAADKAKDDADDGYGHGI